MRSPARVDLDAPAQAAGRLRPGRAAHGPARAARRGRPVRGLQGPRRAHDPRGARGRGRRWRGRHRLRRGLRLHGERRATHDPTTPTTTSGRRVAHRPRRAPARGKMPVMSETPAFEKVTGGLQFPEGPIAMADGIGRAHRDQAQDADPGARPTARPSSRGRHRRWAERRGHRTRTARSTSPTTAAASCGWRSASWTIPGDVPEDWTGGCHPAGRPGHRRGRDARTPSATGQRPPGAQRPRVRRRRRHLVHRPRREGGAGQTHAGVLYRAADGTDQPGGLPHRVDERHRAVAGRRSPLRGRDPQRAGVGVGRHRPRPGRP